MPIYEILCELFERHEGDGDFGVSVTKLKTGYKVNIEFETTNADDVAEVERFINQTGILDELHI